MTKPTRRDVLRASGVVAVGALAGCSALGDDTPEEPSYRQLPTTAVYVADGVDLSVPPEIETVSDPVNADLVVVPADTSVTAEQAVQWLADGRAVALLGDAAEETWHAWTGSADYRDTFDTEGYADSDPDPELLVAGAIGLDVTTYRYSWGEGPSDEDVLGALDESLVDIETRTPQ